MDTPHVNDSLRSCQSRLSSAEFPGYLPWVFRLSSPRYDPGCLGRCLGILWPFPLGQPLGATLLNHEVGSSWGQQGALLPSRAKKLQKVTDISRVQEVLGWALCPKSLPSPRPPTTPTLPTCGASVAIRGGWVSGSACRVIPQTKATGSSPEGPGILVSFTAYPLNDKEKARTVNATRKTKKRNCYHRGT